MAAAANARGSLALMHTIASALHNATHSAVTCSSAATMAHIPMTATNLLSFARSAAMGAYAIVAVVCLAGAFSAMSGFIARAETLWTPDRLAHTFIFMLLVVASALALQYRRPFSWPLLMQVLVTGALLALSTLNHGFPERSVYFAVPHIVLAVVFATMNFVAVVKDLRARSSPK